MHTSTSRRPFSFSIQLSKNLVERRGVEPLNRSCEEQQLPVTRPIWWRMRDSNSLASIASARSTPRTFPIFSFQVLVEKMRFELTTLTLQKFCSPAELHPHVLVVDINVSRSVDPLAYSPSNHSLEACCASLPMCLDKMRRDTVCSVRFYSAFLRYRQLLAQ